MINVVQNMVDIEIMNAVVNMDIVEILVNIVVLIVNLITVYMDIILLLDLHQMINVDIVNGYSCHPGYCCSKFGYCGDEEYHCGLGCQNVFDEC